MRPTTEGTIHTDRLDIGKAIIKQAILDGIAYIPEDRHHVATAGNINVANNVIMKN